MKEIKISNEAYKQLVALQTETETLSDTIIRLSLQSKRSENKVFVESSLIDWIEYDEEDKILKIGFNRGTIYKYVNVPKHEFEGLKDASSKGSYFNYNIRNAYQYYQL